MIFSCTTNSCAVTCAGVALPCVDCASSASRLSSSFTISPAFPASPTTWVSVATASASAFWMFAMRRASAATGASNEGAASLGGCTPAMPTDITRTPAPMGFPSVPGLSASNAAWIRAVRSRPACSRPKPSTWSRCVPWKYRVVSRTATAFRIASRCSGAPS